MRSLIQYDLDEPLTGPTNPLGPPPPPHRHTRRPPTKKRKRNQFGPARETPLQHWDDPGSAAVGVVYDEQERGAMTPAPLAAGSDMVSYTDDVEEGEVEYGEEPTVEGEDAADADAEQGEGEEEEEEESRVLTHEEIWDDAALINAWNSAEAEYKVLFPSTLCPYTSLTHARKAYHGASKAWKTEPVKKSPLCVPFILQLTNDPPGRYSLDGTTNPIQHPHPHLALANLKHAQNGSQIKKSNLRAPKLTPPRLTFTHSSRHTILPSISHPTPTPIPSRPPRSFSLRRRRWSVATRRSIMH